MRNFEQIRDDVCYQNLDVKIVGVGAGFSYGPYGHTHHALEDIGILRTIPNLVILTPGDPVEAALATNVMLAHKGPVYLRLGKSGEPILHTKKPVFKIGKGIIMQEGNDLTIIAASSMLARAMETAATISARQRVKSVKNKRSEGAAFSVRVISMATIKPLDESIILESAKKTHAVVTLEEHSIIGGLGSAVAEILAESGIPVRFKRIGVPDRFTKVIGLQEFMRKANGLDVESIIAAIQDVLS